MHFAVDYRIPRQFHEQNQSSLTCNEDMNEIDSFEKCEKDKEKGYECSLFWIRADYKSIPKDNGFFLCIYDNKYVIIRYDETRRYFINIHADTKNERIEEYKITHWLKIDKPTF